MAKKNINCSNIYSFEKVKRSVHNLITKRYDNRPHPFLRKGILIEAILVKNGS